MKKILNILIILSLCVAATSCRWKKGEDVGDDRTASGKQVYLYTESVMIDNILFLNMAQNVDLYLKTTDPTEQLDLGRQLFYNSKIEVNGDKVSITGNGEQWQFATKGSSIEAPGAQWGITLKVQFTPEPDPIAEVIPAGGYIITCTETDHWSIKTQNVLYQRCFDGTADLDIIRTAKRIDDTFGVNSDYTVSGSGKFRSADSVFPEPKGQFLSVDYIITEPMPCWLNLRRYMEEFYGGKFEMTVNTANVKNDKIGADLTKSEGTGRQVFITQRGFTERLYDYFYER